MCTTLVSPDGPAKPRSLEPNYCDVAPNQACQLMCKGCDQIQALLYQKRRSAWASELNLEPRKIHNSFIELERCAKYCVACQVIRRAILLKQITNSDVDRLRITKIQQPIYATLAQSKELRLQITLGKLNTLVYCHGQNKTTHFTPNKLGATPNIPLIKRWLNECQEHHSCSKFAYSSNNPSWLLEIMPGKQARVIKGPDKLVRYIVLSYSWGNPNSPEMTTAEWERIKSAATLRSEDGQIVSERTSPFSWLELPETMQDSIRLAEHLSISYIWIDSICIPKGSDWDREGSKMVEVYGNAMFTLCACSSRKATEHFITEREAWTYPARGCKIDNQWLSTASNSLADVRKRAPTAERGWILQEERLSPRILYWTSQEIYWACPGSQHFEPSHAHETSIHTHEKRSHHFQFLQSCYQGDAEQLEEEWLDLVESYTRKDLAKSRDRFTALAGLATRYLEAVSTPDCPMDEEYLAGLWRNSFAKQLTWSVERAADPREDLHSLAPSWSWASLPLQTETSLRHCFQPAPAFHLLQERFTADTDDASTAVIKGAYVKAVTVRGRLRRLLGSSAKQVPWERITRRIGLNPSERFNFSDEPQQSVFARHSENGEIVSYEAHKEPILGQLDYSLYEYESEKGPTQTTLAVPSGAEKDLVCLEIGLGAMLLLRPEQQHGLDSVDRYQRVGICLNHRKGFFSGSLTHDLILC